MVSTTTRQPMVLINAIGDGNCGYNSFAIWFALHYLAHGPRFIDEYHQAELKRLLNAFFKQYPDCRNTTQIVQENFRAFLENNDLNTIQTTLAPVLRILSVDYLRQTLSVSSNEPYPDIRMTLKQALGAAFREYAARHFNIPIRETGSTQNDDIWLNIPEAQQIFNQLLKQLPSQCAIRSVDELDRYMDQTNICKPFEGTFTGQLADWFENQGCEAFLTHTNQNGYYVNHTVLAALAQNLGLGLTVERHGQVWAQYDGNTTVTLVNEIIHWNAKIPQDLLQEPAVQAKVDQYRRDRNTVFTLHKTRFNPSDQIYREFDYSLRTIQHSVNSINKTLCKLPKNNKLITELSSEVQKLITNGIQVNIKDVPNLAEAHDLQLAIQLQKEEIEAFFNAHQHTLCGKESNQPQSVVDLQCEADQYRSNHHAVLAC